MSATRTSTEASEMPCDAAVEVFRKDYLPPQFRIRHCDLALALAFDETRVRGKLHMRRVRGSPPCTLVLHGGKELHLRSAALNGAVLKHGVDFRRRDDGSLQIEESALPRSDGEEFTLELETSFSPEKNLSLAGIYKAGPLICSQCEAEGFRNICFYLDRPDVMATFTVRLEAEAKAFPVLLSNGEQIEAGQEGTRHFAKFNDPWPKPCYLFAVVAGDLEKQEDVFVRSTGEPVKLVIWSEAKDVARLQWAMQALKKAMTWDQEKFGRVYDLPVFNLVAVSHFNFGAMENKSLNIFNSSALLADKDIATDARHQWIQGVVAHEYFHNWTGNRVACRDWFQVTLKEGLTRFRDQLFSSDMNGHACQRVSIVSELKELQFPEDAGPLRHPIRPESYRAIDNFYTSTVYTKGAEVVRMYRTILGVDGFRKGMDLYFERHDGQSTTCDDFLAAMADANNVDLLQFAKWYSQAGTPTVTVVRAEADGADFVVTLRQDAGEATPLWIPVATGVLAAGTGKEVVATRLLHLREPEQTFIFKNAVTDGPVIPSFLREFSAPVNLVAPQIGLDQALVLMAHDTDAYVRVSAAERLMVDLVVAKSKNVSGGGLSEAEIVTQLESDALAAGILKGIERTLADERTDRRLKCQIVSPPPVAELVQHVKPCDPPAVGVARRALCVWVARKLHKCFAGLYAELSAEAQKAGDEYVVTPEAVALRCLRNTALQFVSLVEGPGVALAHYKAAKCLNDRQAAMNILADYPTGTAEREEALSHFERTYHDEPLLMQTWVACQARAADNSHCLEDCKRLWTHPSLDKTNPNYVRALLRTFAQNHVQFHRADGAAYAWLAEAIAEVDAFNGSAAAGAARELAKFRMYTADRQKLQQEALHGILRARGEKISSNLREVVSRALEN